jgi:LemA protein
MTVLNLTFIFLFLIVFVILSVYTVIAFNTFQRIRLNVEKSRKNIAVLCKQRFDELPRLVEICKTYFDKEASILGKLTQLRVNFEGKEDTGKGHVANSEEAPFGGDEFEKFQDITEINELNNDLTSLTKTIGAVAESYPTLQSSQQYLFLMRRLAELEEQIADRREYYNEAVSLYNARLVSIPDVFFGKALGYQSQEFLEVPKEECEVPKL